MTALNASPALIRMSHLILSDTVSGALSCVACRLSG